jgi:hypothetical protein
MKPYASKILRAGGLLLAASTSSFLPGPGGYDAATGATATTPAPPPPPANPRYVAQIKAGKSAKGSFTRTVAPKQEKFTGTLQLALPNAALGLTDAATAADAEIVLELSRGGMAYAECTLDFAGLSKNRRTASYKVDVLNRRGVLQQKTGFCHLQVTPYGPGLPQPVSRDRMALKAITPYGEQTFASGVFVKK